MLNDFREVITELWELTESCVITCKLQIIVCYSMLRISMAYTFCSVSWGRDGIKFYFVSNEAGAG